MFFYCNGKLNIAKIIYSLICLRIKLAKLLFISRYINNKHKHFKVVERRSVTGEISVSYA